MDSAATNRSRGQRAGLTRTTVVRAALDVMVESGSLSMRSVAARLGVAPNAIYSYVADKSALIDAVLDERLCEIPVPDSDDDPREQIVGCMTRTFDVLLDEPSLVPFYLARHGSSGPRATELGSALEAQLRRLHVSESQTRSVVRVLVLQTIGISAQAASDDGPIPVPEFRGLLEASVGWIVDGAAHGAG